MKKAHINISTNLIFLCFIFGDNNSNTIRVAVASNFSVTMDLISKHFEEETSYKVRLIQGSTGKHYAQIKHGSPIDIFFAADEKRPKILDDQGLGISNTRFTYAIGKIILWSPEENYVDPYGGILLDESIYKIAIANPQLAPYGRAAKEFLLSSGLWSKLKMKIVMGENIGQTFHFVNSGNASLGFVSASQVKYPGFLNYGSYWEIPDGMYSPILQDAILLRDTSAGRAFIKFIKGAKSKNIIRKFGYRVPDYE